MARFVEIGAAFAVVLGLLALMSPRLFPRDNSDGPNKRSGLTIHRDHLTGCEYFSRGRSLTPRMRADGTQVCTKD